MSIENQTLSDYSFCNMLSSECWSFIASSLKSFALPKSMKNLKWIPTLYIQLCRKRAWKILISPRNETNGKQYVREVVKTASLRMQRATSSRELFVLLTISMIRESRDCLKKKSGLPKCCVFLAKPIVATIERVTSTNSVAGVSIKRTLENCGDGPMSKYRKVLEEAVNVISTNRGFRTMKHSVATYEQTKKDCLVSTQNVL